MAKVCFSCMSSAIPNLMMWINDLIFVVLPIKKNVVLMYHISSSVPLGMMKHSLILKLCITLVSQSTVIYASFHLSFT